jgi:signal peptidase II
MRVSSLTMGRVRPLRIVFVAAMVAGLVGCDHATKLVAETTLRDRPPVPVVPGLLDLSYTQNHDVAFNAFERLQLHPSVALLTACAAVATLAIVVAWFRRRRRASALSHAGFALVLGGALGNAIDRVARGGVVDFIHIRFWPVFNVADIAVCAGIALMFLGLRARPEDVRSPS